MVKYQMSVIPLQSLARFPQLIPTGLGRRVVGAVVLLLLLMSGDIEMNPGPVGECTCLINVGVKF